VLEHFRQYPRYQTRINAILRAAMEHEKKLSETWRTKVYSGIRSRTASPL
jgi:hypothetical protein